MYRPTRDLDFLGYGEASTDRLRTIFQSLCSMDVESDDGLVFDPVSVRVEEIREDQEYGGLRVKLEAHLGDARIPLQVDVGFGDAITPEARETEYPTLLDLPKPHIKVYPLETVIAEKLQTMIALGIANSRMKDYHDLLVIADTFTVPGITLAKAIRATFDRRRTDLPVEVPLALSPEFSGDTGKQTQWQGFLNRMNLKGSTDLPQVVQRLRIFLLEPLEAARTDAVFDSNWAPDRPWS